MFVETDRHNKTLQIVSYTIVCMIQRKLHLQLYNSLYSNKTLSIYCMTKQVASYVSIDTTKAQYVVYCVKVWHLLYIVYTHIHGAAYTTMQPDNITLTIRVCAMWKTYTTHSAICAK